MSESDAALAALQRQDDDDDEEEDASFAKKKKKPRRLKKAVDSEDERAIAALSDHEQPSKSRKPSKKPSSEQSDDDASDDEEEEAYAYKQVLEKQRRSDDKKASRSLSKSLSRLVDAEAAGSGDDADHQDDYDSDNDDVGSLADFVTDEVIYSPGHKKARAAAAMASAAAKRNGISKPEHTANGNGHVVKMSSSLVALKRGDSGSVIGGRTSSMFKGVKGVNLANKSSSSSTTTTPTLANKTQLEQLLSRDDDEDEQQPPEDSFDPVSTTSLPGGETASEGENTDGEENDAPATKKSRSASGKSSSKPKKHKPPPIDISDYDYVLGMKFYYMDKKFKITHIGAPQPPLTKTGPKAYDIQQTQEQMVSTAVELGTSTPEPEYSMFLLRDSITPHLITKTEWDRMIKDWPPAVRAKMIKDKEKYNNLSTATGTIRLVVHPSAYQASKRNTDRNKIVKAAKDTIGVVSPKLIDEMLKAFIADISVPDLHSLLKSHVSLWKALESCSDSSERAVVMTKAFNLQTLSAILCFLLIAIDRYRTLIPDVKIVAEKKDELVKKGYMNGELPPTSPTIKSAKPAAAPDTTAAAAAAPLDFTPVTTPSNSQAAKPSVVDNDGYGEPPGEPADWMLEE